VDINEPAHAYSHSFGNRIEALSEYCLRSSYEGDVSDLEERIKTMQGAIFDIIWQHSERQPLTGQEI
jgi:hypothetical protein